VVYPKSPLEGLGQRLLAVVPISGFVAIFAARFGAAGVVAAAACATASLSAMLAWQVSASKRVCLVIDSGGHVRFRGALRERSLFVERPPDKAVRCCWKRGAGTGLVEVWLLVNRDGSVELALSARAWRSEDLAAVCDRLGIREDVGRAPLNTKELIAEYPGVLPPWTLHIRAVAVAATLILIVVIWAVVALPK
jgi:hypothetical protein